MSVKMKKVKKTAVCGMTAALSVVLMLLNNILPVLMYVLPILTGLLVMLVARLTDKKWALGVFFSTAVLSMLLVTEKDAPLTYTLFFGYYPLIKDAIEKLPKTVARAIKFLLFNAAAVGIGFLGVYVFGISGEEYNEFGKFTIPVLLVLANIVFLLYEMILKKYRVLFDRVVERLEKILK